MSNDPLLPYLIEIIQCPEAEGVILSGGFGIRLKQAFLRSSQQQTLISEVPTARATQDIDLILALDFWIQTEKAKGFKEVLDRLGYVVNQYSWQFRKPIAPENLQHILLDLQARQPRTEERVNVQDRPPQVGRGMGTGISGRQTLEAFAVEDSPQSITITTEQGEYSVLVPHPYAWLNLKVAAAHDWLKERAGEIPPKTDRETGVSRRLKHVLDVYILVAMLTEVELSEAIQLAETYREHPQAEKIRREAIELWGKPDAAGFLEMQRYVRQVYADAVEIDYTLFWTEGLRVALGIEIAL
jgi:hypothetical protein